MKIGLNKLKAMKLSKKYLYLLVFSFALCFIWLALNNVRINADDTTSLSLTRSPRPSRCGNTCVTVTFPPNIIETNPTLSLTRPSRPCRDCVTTPTTPSIRKYTVPLNGTRNLPIVVGNCASVTYVSNQAPISILDSDCNHVTFKADNTLRASDNGGSDSLITITAKGTDGSVYTETFQVNATVEKVTISSVSPTQLTNNGQNNMTFRNSNNPGAFYKFTFTGQNFYGATRFSMAMDPKNCSLGGSLNYNDPSMGTGGITTFNIPTGTYYICMYNTPDKDGNGGGFSTNNIPVQVVSSSTSTSASQGDSYAQIHSYTQLENTIQDNQLLVRNVGKAKVALNKNGQSFEFDTGRGAYQIKSADYGFYVENPVDNTITKIFTNTNSPYSQTVLKDQPNIVVAEQHPTSLNKVWDNPSFRPVRNPRMFDSVPTTFTAPAPVASPSQTTAPIIPSPVVVTPTPTINQSPTRHYKYEPLNQGNIYQINAY